MEKWKMEEIQLDLEKRGLSRELAKTTLNKLVTIAKTKLTGNKAKRVDLDELVNVGLIALYTALENNTYEEIVASYLNIYMEMAINKELITNKQHVKVPHYFRKVWHEMAVMGNKFDVDKTAKKLDISVGKVKSAIDAKWVENIDSIFAETITPEGDLFYKYLDDTPFYASTTFANSHKDKTRECYRASLSDLYYNHMDVEEKAIYNQFKETLEDDLLQILEMKEFGFLNKEIAKKLKISTGTVSKKSNKIVSLWEKWCV